MGIKWKIIIIIIYEYILFSGKYFFTFCFFFYSCNGYFYIEK